MRTWRKSKVIRTIPVPHARIQLETRQQQFWLRYFELPREEIQSRNNSGICRIRCHLSDCASSNVVVRTAVMPSAKCAAPWFARGWCFAGGPRPSSKKTEAKDTDESKGRQVTKGSHVVGIRVKRTHWRQRRPQMGAAFAVVPRCLKFSFDCGEIPSSEPNNIVGNIIR